MADVIDRAQNINDLLTQEIIQHHAQVMAGQNFQESAEFCEKCSQPIPEARRKAIPGCRLCVQCQQEMDERK